MVGTSEWTRFLFDRGPIGEHARWLLSSDRGQSFQRHVRGVEKVVPGPGPLGLKVPTRIGMYFIDVDPVSQLGGWLLTLYAVIRIIRRR